MSRKRIAIPQGQPRDQRGHFVAAQPVSPEEREVNVSKLARLELECRTKALALQDALPAERKKHVASVRANAALCALFAAPFLYVYFRFPEEYGLFEILAGFAAFWFGKRVVYAMREAAATGLDYETRIKEYLFLADNAKDIRLSSDRLVDRRHWLEATSNLGGSKLRIDARAPVITSRQMEVAEQEVLLSADDCPELKSVKSSSM